MRRAPPRGAAGPRPGTRRGERVKAVPPTRTPPGTRGARRRGQKACPPVAWRHRQCPSGHGRSLRLRSPGHQARDVPVTLWWAQRKGQGRKEPHTSLHRVSDHQDRPTPGETASIMPTGKQSQRRCQTCLGHLVRGDRDWQPSQIPPRLWGSRGSSGAGPEAQLLASRLRSGHRDNLRERPVNRLELMEGDGATPPSGIWILACLWASETLARWRRSPQPINLLVNHAGHLVIRARASPIALASPALGYHSLTTVQTGARSRGLRDWLQEGCLLPQLRKPRAHGVGALGPAVGARGSPRVCAARRLRGDTWAHFL